MSLATWLASEGAIVIENDENLLDSWRDTLALTGLVASMVVNALVTGLIVFKILKVFLEVKPTSVEQTLSSFDSTGSPKLRQIIFIIIEYGNITYTCRYQHLSRGLAASRKPNPLRVQYCRMCRLLVISKIYLSSSKEIILHVPAQAVEKSFLLILQWELHKKRFFALIDRVLIRDFRAVKR